MNSLKLIKFLVFLFFIPFGVLSQTGVTKIVLNNFVFKEVDSTNWMPAKVPGTVHTDLFANNKICNPFYADNESKLQWIESRNWEYITKFTISEDFFSMPNINLVFEGLDTYADVILNGVKILKADNMFRTWTVDIHKEVNIGENELKIIFYSAYNQGLPFAKALDIELPGGNDRGEIKTSVFTRKAPYHYGWDWGPRFVTAGIWRPAYVLAWSDLNLDDLWLKPVSVNKQIANYDAIATIYSQHESPVKISVYVNGILSTSEQKIIHKGENTLTLPIIIQKPRLWWPNGMGEHYQYQVEFVIENSTSKVKIEKKLGVRKIELIQTPDSIGEAFYFKVNEVPFFAKGANYIPMDNFLPNATKTKKDSLLSMASDAGFNMIRVWGGGAYEEDCFYDLCDAKGLLVWQDFMFACALYPWDSLFLNNVKVEAIQNIKRLRNHPSLALWCGNNEMDEAWNNWGWQQQYKWSSNDSVRIWNGYQKLFSELLPAQVTQFDPASNYISSSPKYGWGRAKSYTHGDSHYWGVWWGMAPFETYQTKMGRFASEYGFQSIPSISSIEQFVPKEQMNTESVSMKTHQKHATGYQTINQYMLCYYPTPKTFEDTVNISQALQAYGIKTAIEAHRRNRPYCMGSLFWQLNDCWPSVSWSCVDYYFKPKALYYQAKRSFNNLLLSATKSDSILSIVANSDLMSDTTFELKFQLLDFKGTKRWNMNKVVTIKAHTANVVAQLNLLKEITVDTTCNLLNMQLLQNGKLVSESNHFFAFPKDLKLERPNPTIVVRKISSKLYEITIKSKVLLKEVSLTPSIQGQLSDNFFDLLPNCEKKIQFQTNETGELKISFWSLK